MSFTFIECNKAVNLMGIIPNPWRLAGYPRVYGHLPNNKEHTYIYLSSLNEYQTMLKLMKEADLNNDNSEMDGWAHAYLLTLDPVPSIMGGIVYNINTVKIVSRMCAAK
jgi:hypothetical protein